MKAERSATPEQRAQDRREKLAAKAARRERWHHAVTVAHAADRERYALQQAAENARARKAHKRPRLIPVVHQPTADILRNVS